MECIFESKRLLFRKFTSEDEQLIYDLNLDPEVTKYTLDPVTDLAQARNILLDVILPQYELYGHGRWATYTKDGGQFIGWCGLKYRPEVDEIDLGYRLMKPFWGKGYATEAALSTINYGFDLLKISTITGRALPDNIASIRVMEKCGMQNVGVQNIEGLDHITFKVSNK